MLPSRWEKPGIVVSSADNHNTAVRAAMQKHFTIRNKLSLQQFSE
jgi:hypothetical protein